MDTTYKNHIMSITCITELSVLILLPIKTLLLIKSVATDSTSLPHHRCCRAWKSSNVDVKARGLDDGGPLSNGTAGMPVELLVSAQSIPHTFDQAEEVAIQHTVL